MLSTKLIRRVPDLKVLLSRDLHKTSKNYYDLLGLTPHATPADIKKAYYEMSLLYHPDMLEGSPEKFRELTTAYEILGNSKLRKLYDQGLMSEQESFNMNIKQTKTSAKSGNMNQGASKKTKQKTESEHREFHENASKKVHSFEDFIRKRNPFVGRSEKFDYETWTKSHYSDTFTKQQDARRKARMDDLVFSERMLKADKYFFMGGAIFLVWLMYFQATTHDCDNPRRYKSKRD